MTWNYILVELFISYTQIKAIIGGLMWRSLYICLTLCVLLCLAFLLRKLFYKNIFIRNTVWLIPVTAVFAYGFTNYSNIIPIELHLFLISDMVTWAYLSGILIILIARKVKNRKLKKALKTSRLCDCENLAHILEQVKQAVGIKRKITVKQTRFICPPFILGIIKPTVYLPNDWKEKYSRQELRYILTHELIHLKQGDLFIRGVMRVVQTVLWYNPLVYVASRLLSSDREMLCDTKTLEMCGGKSEYGRIVLRESVNDPALAPLFAGFASSGNIKKRINNITAHKAIKKRAVYIVLACMIFTCSLISFSLVAYSETNKIENVITVNRVEDSQYFMENQKLPNDYFSLIIDDFAGLIWIENRTLYISREILLDIAENINPEDERVYSFIYYPCRSERHLQAAYSFHFTYDDVQNLACDYVVVRGFEGTVITRFLMFVSRIVN